MHGNVNNLLQLITHDGNVLAKTVNYEYDLISGKVNKVYFQKEKSDQLIHKYTYDGDNRITQVETSTDNVLFTKEASYQYYAHGPLARTQLGELNVETENYTYTIQGWIKQMQAEAFSYALGYNNTDYASIGTSATILATPIATVGTTSKGLYNGNIASMTSKTPVIASANWQQQYSYDQLNRITASATPGTPATNAYKTTYSYDANGNILNLARYDGDNTKFDELSYNYQTKAKGYLQNTNKLRWVDDAVGASATTSDIEDQSLDNYSYDAIGNLIKDKQEEIDTIKWTVSGKVRKIIRTLSSTKPNLEFEYDASGQRIVKKVIRKDGSIASTYYLRDASGNVMSVYTYNSVSDDIPKLSEQYVYGSSRIGVATPGAGTVTTALKNILGSRAFGRKSYELSDHLGNVRATLSDYRRLASQAIVNSATDYYPFGMVARTYASAEQYRFGYNGKEHDDDIVGGGYDFGLRIFDSRLGRFLSIDPLFSSLSFISPYNYAANNPIYLIDRDGALPSPGMLAFRAALYQLKTYAKATDVNNQVKGVVSISLGFSGKAGVAIAGGGIKLSVGIAADPYGNYAVTGTAGLFLDLFGGIGGWSFEDKNPSNGNFYFGAAGGLSGTAGYLPGYKHVSGLAGTFNEFDIDAPAVSGTVYSDPNRDPKGVGISKGPSKASAGAGFGNMQTFTNVYAFTDADLQIMQDAIETTENVYLEEIWNNLNPWSTTSYSNVSRNYMQEVTDNGIRVTLTVTGVNKDGVTVVLSSKVALEMYKADDGYFKTKNVKDEVVPPATTVPAQ